MVFTLSNLYQKTIAKNYFLSSLIILWLYFIALYPNLFQEACTEHAINYLFYAYNKTFAENVWKDDAGYLVWLPRAIALLVSAIASPYWFILITNIIAQGFLAFFVAFINHPGFDDILPRHMRFALSLIFGMIILPNYEIFIYVNFVYTGFIFISFLLFLNKEKLRGGGQNTYFTAFYARFCAFLNFILLSFFPFSLGL